VTPYDPASDAWTSDSAISRLEAIYVVQDGDLTAVLVRWDVSAGVTDSGLLEWAGERLETPVQWSGEWQSDTEGKWRAVEAVEGQQ